MFFEKGFTLIELIVYIGLLSILIVGVFYTAISLNLNLLQDKSFTKEDYDLLISNLHE